MSFTKPNKGSVLVFSLIVLSIVLSAALSVTVVNVSNRKSAGSTGQSVQSFQVADSGVEMVLKEIYKGSRSNVSALVSAISGASCNATSGSFTFPVSGGPSTATVTFMNTANGVISCTDNSATSTWRDDIAKIKVEGTSAGTTRVIETAIAAPGCRLDSCYVLHALGPQECVNRGRTYTGAFDTGIDNSSTHWTCSKIVCDGGSQAQPFVACP